ncbi:MAG TPA: hypothetical protein VKX24_11320 [Acidimicrobiia bacterium]|nr:hypothetical protein [Acidimicrobiia bacterium]
MSNRFGSATSPRGRRLVSGLGALALPVLVATGCSIVHKAATAVHAVEGNRATIDGFTSSLSSQPSSFEVRYATTGSSPGVVVYAAQSPDEVAFTLTPSGSATPSLDVVVNPSGEYACEPPGQGSPPTACQKLASADKASEAQVYGLYTPAHWVAFLRGLALAAGLAGDKVSRSSMSVNGFALSCVDLVASGVPGTSVICSTSFGLLGYVKVASDPTSFEITSYSSSPGASLFALPPGATVSTSPATTAPTG